MDILTLRQFVQIVDFGSIQGAARQLGVSRSVLRRSIDELEASIGAPLLHRDPSGVRLTAAGAVTLERARPLLDAAQALVVEARAAENEPRGVVRIIEPVGLPMAMHVQGILAAHALMPRQQVSVRQVENPMAELNHPFELMLHEGPPPHRNTWFSRVVARVRLRPVASREYLQQRGVPQSVEELAEHETLGWIRPGHPAGTWPLLAGGAIELQHWFSSADPNLLATLAARGGGIFLGPDLPFSEASEEERLQPVLEDAVGAEIVFRVTTPFPARADPRTRNTVALIVAQLEGLPQD